MYNYIYIYYVLNPHQESVRRLFTPPLSVLLLGDHVVRSGRTGMVHERNCQPQAPAFSITAEAVGFQNAKELLYQKPELLPKCTT